MYYDKEKTIIVDYEKYEPLITIGFLKWRMNTKVLKDEYGANDAIRINPSNRLFHYFKNKEGKVEVKALPHDFKPLIKEVLVCEEHGAHLLKIANNKFNAMLDDLAKEFQARARLLRGE